MIAHGLLITTHVDSKRSRVSTTASRAPRHNDGMPQLHILNYIDAYDAASDDARTVSASAPT